jgi:hypothetical protein
MITPTNLIERVLDCVDGVEVEGDLDVTVSAMLGAATVLAGIALRRLDPFSRERLLREIEPNVRDYIDKVNAAEARRLLPPGSAYERRH